jgi:uncharacterized protein (DUF1330 family)
MMPAYVIYQAEALDAARYEEYKAQAGPNVAAAGGRYLVRGGEGVARINLYIVNGID